MGAMESIESSRKSSGELSGKSSGKSSRELSDRRNSRDRVVRVARFCLLVTGVSFGLCAVAMFRIARIDPTRVGSGTALDIALPALAVALAGLLLGAVLDQVVDRIGGLGRWLVRRMQPDRAPGSHGIPEDTQWLENSRWDVTRAILVLAGVWAAFKWLSIPLAVPGRGAVSVPMIGANAGPLLIPFSIGVGLEVVLGLVRLIHGESRRWWLARALLRLAWIGFMIVVITGPNLLVGDPLEWASSIGPAPLSVEWLEAAPRVMAAAWPLARVALAGALVWQLLMLSREVPRIWQRVARPVG